MKALRQALTKHLPNAQAQIKGISQEIAFEVRSPSSGEREGVVPIPPLKSSYIEQRRNDNDITLCYSTAFTLKAKTMPSPYPQGPANKREALNLRIRAEDRELIDRAAQIKGKNRTDFILEAAKSAAQLALLDQTVIMADPEAYAAFLTELDNPVVSNDTLRKTLHTPAPWDK